MKAGSKWRPKTKFFVTKVFAPRVKLKFFGEFMFADASNGMCIQHPFVATWKLPKNRIVKTCANSFYHIIFFNFATWIWYHEVTIRSMEKSLQKMVQTFHDFRFCLSLYFYAQNELNFYCKLCSQTISHSVWNLKYIAWYTAILPLHLQWFVIIRMWNIVK